MSPRAWVLFTLSSVIWGLPYLFIKVAVDAGVPPAFVAWSRVALAGALLVPLAWYRGALRGLHGRGGAIVGYAACEVAVPFVLIASASGTSRHPWPRFSSRRCRFWSRSCR